MPVATDKTRVAEGEQRIQRTAAEVSAELVRDQQRALDQHDALVRAAAQARHVLVRVAARTVLPTELAHEVDAAEVALWEALFPGAAK